MDGENGTYGTGAGGGKIFSNRWKTGEKVFQSLEKSGGVFQPLESFFQSLENPPFCDEPADWPKSGRGARPGEAFEMGQGVGGKAEAAVEEVVGAQAGVFLHQGLDFVDGAGEVGPWRANAGR